MIEPLEGLPAGVIGFRAVGTIEASDYRDVLDPAIDAAVAEHDRIDLVFVMGDEFDHYSLGAMLQDAKLVSVPHEAWGRAAFVTNHEVLGGHRDRVRRTRAGRVPGVPARAAGRGGRVGGGGRGDGRLLLMAGVAGRSADAGRPRASSVELQPRPGERAERAEHERHRGHGEQRGGRHRVGEMAQRAGATIGTQVPTSAMASTCATTMMPIVVAIPGSRPRPSVAAHAAGTAISAVSTTSSGRRASSPKPAASVTP